MHQAYAAMMTPLVDNAPPTKLYAPRKRKIVDPAAAIYSWKRNWGVSLLDHEEEEENDVYID